MAQFTLTVTCDINPKYDNQMTVSIAKKDIHTLLAQWANRYGHSVVISEDTMLDDVDHAADGNCDCDTCADNRAMSAEELNRAVLPVVEQFRVINKLTPMTPHDALTPVQFTIGEIRRFLAWWANVKPQ